MDRIKLFDKTRFIKAGDIEGLKDAASHLANGDVVAFPTETVYGLGADAFNSEAVEKIFGAKGRPGDNPLIVHISDKSQIADLASEVSDVAQKLIDAFMPGPITVIVKKTDKVPSNVTAGLDTVGIRMPSHPVANRFLAECGCPVAAPSANLSGSPSPTRAAHVYNDMDGYIYAVIDGGDSDYGLESTVVDATGAAPVILRPGAVTAAEIEEVCGVDTTSHLAVSEGETPKAPGMKYRHYAPKAEVKVFDLPSEIELDEEGVSDEPSEEEGELSEEERRRLFSIAGPFIMEAQKALKEDPLKRLGIYCGKEVKDLFEKLGDPVLMSHIVFFVYGSAGNVRMASHYLFDGLRTLDIQDVNLILAQGFEGEGLSKAYMNRLMKAAGRSGDAPKFYEAPDKHSIAGEDFESTMTASVLFVCDSNRTLSIAAEGIFDNLLKDKAPFVMEEDRKCEAEIYCESAGFTAADGEKPDQKMIRAMDKLGISIAHKVTSRASVFVYDRNDLILTMRDDETAKVLKAFPDLRGRVFSLSSYLASKGLVFKDGEGRTAAISIPDPSGENDATYEHTAKALEAWITLMFPYILKDLGAMRA